MKHLFRKTKNLLLVSTLFSCAPHMAYTQISKTQNIQPAAQPGNKISAENKQTLPTSFKTDFLSTVNSLDKFISSNEKDRVDQRWNDVLNMMNRVLASGEHSGGAIFQKRSTLYNNIILLKSENLVANWQQINENLMAFAETI
jgi:hypothetical protein